MKKIAFVSKASGMLQKTGMKLKKHSPEILIVTGVTGVVVSTVLACKATTKLDTILEPAKEDLVKIRKASDDPELADKYSKEDSRKDLTIIYVQTGVKIAKLYAPAFILGTASIASIVMSNNILRKRNVALAAAYTTLDKGFKAYRSRVVERYGEEVDFELKNNVKSRKIEETVIDENGKEKKVKKTVGVVEEIGDWAIYFDDTFSGYCRTPGYNEMFLRGQQHFANDKLRAHGCLFLNEVYELLGLPWENDKRHKAGQVIGWVYDPKNEDENSDNFVDFGIREVYRPAKHDPNEVEKVILLDFNVDGDIWSKM